jgi:hypothetical protein
MLQIPWPGSAERQPSSDGLPVIRLSWPASSGRNFRALFE